MYRRAVTTISKFCIVLSAPRRITTGSCQPIRVTRVIWRWRWCSREKIIMLPIPRTLFRTLTITESWENRRRSMVSVKSADMEASWTSSSLKVPKKTHWPWKITVQQIIKMTQPVAIQPLSLTKQERRKATRTKTKAAMATHVVSLSTPWPAVSTAAIDPNRCGERQLLPRIPILYSAALPLIIRTRVNSLQKARHLLQWDSFRKTHRKTSKVKRYFFVSLVNRQVQMSLSVALKMLKNSWTRSNWLQLIEKLRMYFLVIVPLH